MTIRGKKPVLGTTMYCVQEHLYYVAGRAGPLKEFVVFEGKVDGFHQGGWLDMKLLGKDADGHMTTTHRKVSDIGKTVFYTAREAALLAKSMTEDYERRWNWTEAWDDVPLRRPWEFLLIPEEDRFKTFDMSEVGPLFHVGTMDISKKTRYSLEWNGLSVSNCPDAWERIGEGQVHGDWFRLNKPGMKMLDFYHMTDAEKDVISKWAIEADYAAEDTVYKVLMCTEDGSAAYMLVSTYAEAMEEADGEEDCVKQITSLVPTEKLKAESLVDIHLLHMLDIVTELYAEQVLHYDGVYWDEELDEANYSAPRGVIFNSALPSFTVVKNPVDDNAEEEE